MDETLLNRLNEEAVLLEQYEPVRSVEVVPDLKTLRIHLAVQFPSAFSCETISRTGVRQDESVELVFSDDYPFKAPEIHLRQDFPKCFPHINPNNKYVVPCVIDGSIDDFIQQPAGLLGLVHRLAVWLAKAATDELMDYNQGWEPMRNDENTPLIVLPVEEIGVHVSTSNPRELLVLSGFALHKQLKHTSPVSYVFFLDQESRTANGVEGVVVIPPQDTIDRQYIPNTITNYSSFCQFVRDHLASVSDGILNEVRSHYAKTASTKARQFLVVLGVRRPIMVIGTNSKIEFLPVLFERKNVKHSATPVPHQKAGATVLRPLYNSTPDLLRRLSGVNFGRHGRICQIGCGSLGSKIALHLMRNGNGRFSFVDSNLFLPYHNARHALFARLPQYKALLMAQAATEMGLTECHLFGNISEALQQSKPEDILVDSTASLSVRNQLASQAFDGRLVHTALYEKGTRSIFLVEGENRNPRIDDLFLSLLWKSVDTDVFPIHFTLHDAENVIVGQGCGNLTTVMADSRISIFAAGMAGKIQRMLEGSFPPNGSSEIGISDDGESIAWKTIGTGKTVCLPVRNDGYQVRILSDVAEEMRRQAAATVPNETGGSLLGHINAHTRTITVLSFFPPPVDVISTPSRFFLKDEEHQRRLVYLQEHSGGLVNYLGTWHSHPHGGGSSQTDMTTYALHAKLRHPVPTVCLIVTADIITEFTSD